MAKEEKKVEAKKTAEKEAFKYGIEDIADGLDIKAASARVQLRNHNVKKAGKSYGWNSKAEVEEIIKKLKGSEKKAEPKKAEKKADAKAPAKKTEGKAA